VAYDERLFAGYGDAIIAGSSLDIVDVEPHGAAIAGQKEARQGGRQHHGIAHDDVAYGVPDLVPAPGQSHHAPRAGKSWDVECDLGAAAAGNRHQARIEGERRLRRRTALEGGARIAAGTNLPERPLHPVDQLAVEVADLGR